MLKEDSECYVAGRGGGQGGWGSRCEWYEMAAIKI
jgi:hypothetical protein